jgi:hypothetical protein
MKVEVKALEYDGDFAIVKDGEEIMTFNNEDNIGDTYYSVVALLRALDIEVEEE